MTGPKLGRFWVPRTEPLRVDDEFLRCIGYFAEDSGGGSSQAYDAEATGFFVSVPSAIKPAVYSYFVTAKHVAAELEGRPTAILVNSTQGVRIAMARGTHSWVYSQDTDLAAIQVDKESPCAPHVLAFPTKRFVTPRVIKERDIGPGDEVYTVGLFIHSEGQNRISPIVRSGNIARMVDQVYVNTGTKRRPENTFVDAYLIEARSLGGLSGSPVFVRPTSRIPIGSEIVEGEVSRGLLGPSPIASLLGLLHGHWDINESDLNRTSWEHDDKRGVNVGIAIVIPATKIIELLDLPVLREARERTDARYMESIRSGSDSV